MMSLKPSLSAISAEPALTQSGNGPGRIVKNFSLSGTRVVYLYLDRLQAWLAGAP
jgi:hypothetical protein